MNDEGCSAAPADRQLVETNPRYRVLRELGSGGVGRVFLVRDAHLERDLAFKLLIDRKATESRHVQRLRREFEILTRLRHPGVARAFDFGFLNRRPYFTSEFIAGAPLASGRRARDVSSLLRHARAVAESLAFLHRQGIVHLDVKPSNIIVSQDATPGSPTPAGRSRAVLIDFGLYRTALEPATGEAPGGSLPYMAPEYFDRGEIGPWTDVYAFGVTFYRVLTGRYPRAFDAKSPRGIPDRRSSPTPPSLLAPSFPKELDGILLRCLACQPRSRFPDGERLHAALRRLDRAPRPLHSHREVEGAHETVGRDDELGRLSEFLEAFRRPRDPSRKNGRPVLFITGPAGMGQSHLLREAKLRAQTLGVGADFYLETGYPGRRSVPGAVLRCLTNHLDGEERSHWSEFSARLRRPRRPPTHAATEGERRLRRADQLIRAVSHVERPFLLAIDGLQYFDEVSVGLIVDLSRYLLDRPGEPPPLALIMGFREEGPLRPLLGELGKYLAAPRNAPVISLRGLELAPAMALYRQHRKEGRDGPVAESELAVFQRTGGCPAEIVASSRRETRATPPSTRARTSGREREGGLAGLRKRLLLTLSLLERPARAEELVSMLSAEADAVGESLASFREDGRVTAEIAAGGEIEWQATPLSRVQMSSVGRGERNRAHRGIADALLRSPARAADDPRLVEAVYHLRRAGRKKAVVDHGGRAAQYLKSTFQNRRALEVFEMILESLPHPHRYRRLEVTLELADLRARVGETDRGVTILGDFLQRERGLDRVWRGRIQLHLAVLLSRRGEFRRAASLFVEGFRGVGRGLLKREKLHFMNEQAALSAVTGRYDEARRLCEAGLAAARRNRSLEIRELTLSLHATRAGVALRSFDYDGAVEDYERALETATAIGSAANRAAILNNLGTVYGNRDAYDHAIRAFDEARTVSERLDEGPSLVSIHGNLAVLYAKTGEFAKMEESLTGASRLAPETMSPRQAIFFAHATGLSRLYEGRYSEAETALKEAVTLGENTGDELLTAFDRVFLAEARIFTASYAEAWAELEALAERHTLAQIAGMASSRLAFLAARLGRIDGLESRIDRLGDRAAKPCEGPAVPFLDAWNDVFVGWAASLASAALREREPRRSREFEGAARSALARARSFFARHGLAPAETLVDWIRSESLFLRGDSAGAVEQLRGSRGRTNRLTAILKPLLQARLGLETGTSSELRSPCAELLTEASSGLSGNPLREFEAVTDALYEQIRLGSRDIPEAVLQRRRATTEGLPEDVARAHERSAVWAAWTTPPPSFPLETDGTHPADSVESTGARGDATRTRTLSSAGRRATRLELVAESTPMLELCELLDKIAGSGASVLIRGETGSGKELIARIIYRESSRASRPFLVLDCAAIPFELFELELFGARSGAFTDLQEDRQGLLALAEGGTIFVDEIAHIPLEAQAKLLRVVDTGSYRPLGAASENHADVRFLFSTAEDLEEAVRDGRFREDLQHRIQVLTVRVPPLRERPEDMNGLVRLFLRREDGSAPGVEEDVMAELRRRPWFGNVRELQNLMSRLKLEDAPCIRTEALQRWSARSATDGGDFPANLLAAAPLPALRQRLERAYILHHYKRLGGDTQALSRLLGTSRQQLYRRLRKLGIRLRDL